MRDLGPDSRVVDDQVKVSEPLADNIEQPVHRLLVGHVGCDMQAAVRSARARILTELTVDNTVGFAFHFGDQPFGRVVEGAGEQLTWQAIGTTALFPPPREL